MSNLSIVYLNVFGLVILILGVFDLIRESSLRSWLIMVIGAIVMGLGEYQIFKKAISARKEKNQSFDW